MRDAHSEAFEVRHLAKYPGEIPWTPRYFREKRTGRRKNSRG